MKVSLTDICDFQGGTQPPKDEWIDQPAQGYVRMLQIRDFTQSDKNYIEYVKDTGKLKTCIEDDILIGRYGASIGKILTGLAGAYNVAIVKTIPDEKVVSKKYLYWYLNSQYFQRFISNVGSRAAQAGFNKNDLGAAQIPLVDKERQEEICEVLEKANKLISLRKQQLAKLDELIKARFVEMFGTFPANPFRWDTGKIQDVVSDVRYGSSRPAVEGGKYPYLRMNNITYSGELDLRDTKRIDIPDSELDKCTVRRGDVLFNRTNSKELVGKTCVYNRNELMVLAGFVIRVRINERIRPEVLSAFLNMDFSKRMLIGMCKTAIGQANINAKELQNIDLYIPPIELQDQFVALKNKIDQQKQTVQQSLEKLELMKKALMQEYFG